MAALSWALRARGGAVWLFIRLSVLNQESMSNGWFHMMDPLIA